MDSLDFILCRSFGEVGSPSAGVLYNHSLCKQLHNKKSESLQWIISEMIIYTCPESSCTQDPTYTRGAAESSWSHVGTSRFSVPNNSSLHVHKNEHSGTVWRGKFNIENGIFHEKGEHHIYYKVGFFKITLERKTKFKNSNPTRIEFIWLHEYVTETFDFTLPVSQF